MSLAKAISAARKANDSNRKSVSFINDESSEDEKFTSRTKQTTAVAAKPNTTITIYGGDYMGNLLGLNITGPTGTGRYLTDDDDVSSGDDDDDIELHEEERDVMQKLHSSKLKALTQYLSKKQEGSESSSSSQKSGKTVLIPAVSSDLHAGAVTCISSGVSNYVITGGHDESIRICKITPENRLKEFGVLHRHSCGITCIAMSSCGQIVITGGEDGTLFVWNSVKWDCIGVLKHHTDKVLTITIHPNNMIALTSSKDNKLLMWDIRPNAMNLLSSSFLPKVKPYYGSIALPPISVLFNKTGEYYIISTNRNIQIYHGTGETAGKIARTFEDVDIKILAVEFLDDHRVIIGSEDKNIYIVDITTCQVLLELSNNQHKSRVRFINVLDSKNAEYILSKYSYSLKHMVAEKSDKQNSYAFVSGDTDGVVVLWKVDTLVKNHGVTKVVRKSAKRGKNGKNGKTAKPKYMRKDSDDEEEDSDDVEGDNGSEEEREEAEEIEEIAITVDDAIVKAQALSKLHTGTRLTCLSVAYPNQRVSANDMTTLYNNMKNINEASNKYALAEFEENDLMAKKRKRDEAEKQKQYEAESKNKKEDRFQQKRLKRAEKLKQGESVEKSTARYTMTDNFENRGARFEGRGGKMDGEKAMPRSTKKGNSGPSRGGAPNKGGPRGGPPSRGGAPSKGGPSRGGPPSRGGAPSRGGPGKSGPSRGGPGKSGPSRGGSSKGGKGPVRGKKRF